MDTKELQAVWDAIIEEIKHQPGVNSQQIDAFFSHLQLQDIIPGFCMITAENLSIKQWVDQYYLPNIEQAFLSLYNTPLMVMTTARETQSAQTTSPIQTTPKLTRTSIPFIDTPSSSPTPTASQDLHQLPTINPQQDSLVVNPLVTQGETEVPNPLPLSSTKPIFGTAPSFTDIPNPFASVKTKDATQHEIVKQDSETPAKVPAPAHIATSMTFENFVVGSNNRFAYDYALEVAKNPGRNQVLNPLFIYGKSGLGKTHLMFAIENEIHRSNPHLTIEYVDAMELVSRYADASAENSKDKSSYKNFRQRYENADVLLIDDIQRLAGKTETLNMVFQIFNYCVEHGHQVVLSSDRAPSFINIDERHKSRFNSGQTFEISPYTTETRLAIIKQYLTNPSLVNLAPGITMSIENQQYLAEIAGSNVRDLQSAVTRIIIAQKDRGRDLTKTEISDLLQNHFSSGSTKAITSKDVVKEVARYYNMKVDDLYLREKRPAIVYPRQVAMYLLRELLGMTLDEIGKEFGQNHATVNYGTNKIKNGLKDNVELQGEVETLINQIKEG